MDTHPDPYRLLGVQPGASRREIRRRYRELLRAHHPDVAPDPASAHEYAAALGAAYRAVMSQAPPADEAELDWDGIDLELSRAVREADPGLGGPADLLRRGEALVGARRYVEAQILCAEALVVDPDSPQAHSLLARVYEGLGLRDEAEQERAEAELLERMGPAPFRPAAVATRPRRSGRVSGAAPDARSRRHSPWLLVGSICAGGCLAAATGGGTAPSPLLGVPVPAVAWGAVAAFCLLGGVVASGRMPSPQREVGPVAAWSWAWPAALAGAALAWPAVPLAHLAARLLALETLGAWRVVWSTVMGTTLLVGLTHGAEPVFWLLGGNAIAVGGLLGWSAGSRLRADATAERGTARH